MSVAAQRESLFWFLLGPCFLFAAMPFALFLEQYDLIGIALLGWVASFVFARVGAFYALIALVLLIMGKMIWATPHSIGWLVGIGSSLACSWFITALATEERGSLWEALQEQLSHRAIAIQHLEESFLTHRQEAEKKWDAWEQQRVLLETRCAALQEDHASILALNELLRDASLTHLKEKEEWVHRVREREEALISALARISQMEDELIAARNADACHAQNRELFEQINEVRTREEQTNLINETLARLYANEKQRRIEEQTQASLVEQEAESLREEKEALLREAAKEDRSEGAFLYRQLRQQFAEQKEQLHRTRRELFWMDTKCQTLAREQTEPAYDPEEMRIWRALEQEWAKLEEENLQLHQILGQFSK